MSAFKWDRPRHRILGRKTESITGGDLTALLGDRPRPQQPQKSKAQLRLESEKLVAEFLARRKAAEGTKS
jgi:hypothetical protein